MSPRITSKELDFLLDAIEEERRKAWWRSSGALFDGGSLRECKEAGEHERAIGRVIGAVPDRLWKERKQRELNARAADLRAKADALERGEEIEDPRND